ncbi:MAG: hypothetical protein ABTQ34_09505 [Bdellovibrionales bacterium]
MEEFTLSDALAILNRWKRIFLITTLLIATITTGFALRWSNYRSTATVQIERPDVASNVTVLQNANPSEISQALADQRISEIQQKVTSTASLIEIITKFNLYADLRNNTPIADIAEAMRRRIKVDLISTMLANPASASKISANDLSAIAFNIGFDYSDPLLTQQVVDELTTRFLDEDLKDMRKKSEETAEFLTEQIAQIEQSMAAQEAKIAEHQKTYGANRPEALLFNQQTLANLTMSLNNIDSQITSNEGTQGNLRAQLALVDPYSRLISDGQVLTSPGTQLKALQSQYATLTAQYAPNHPDVVKLRNQIASLQEQTGLKADKIGNNLKAQIQDVRTNLEAAKKTYGSNHPDVVSLQNQLHKLEDQATKLAGPATHSAQSIMKDADNPVYMQIVAQIKASEEQEKALKTQRVGIQEQLASYKTAVLANPEAQKEIATLTRDYENAQLRYRELQAKKASADMQLSMQRDRKGARLTVINPPELPRQTRPARLILLIAGLFMSMLGGLICVTGIHHASQIVLGNRQVNALVGVAPLVTIPRMQTDCERIASKRQKKVLIGVGIVSGAALALMFVMWVMPIDVLTSIIARKLGM